MKGSTSKVPSSVNQHCIYVLTETLSFETMAGLKVKVKCLTLCDPMDYTAHGILQARILEWVAFLLLQGIFPTQGLNTGLLHCRQILYQLSHKGSPRILEWVSSVQSLSRV